ncbi:branched-chain amino acid transaminase [Streptomyces sp. NPDC059989]|uniref:branched-chain amino acid transaminase n=1 Tax=Streptomyces sp. NPDC059989 TaxID=3347026 RepID=UPI00369615F4
MAELSQPEYIWMDGGVRPWAEATVHVWSEVVLRAASVFEGLRGYWNAEEKRHYFVHLERHLSRLGQSAKLTSIPFRMTTEEFTAALGELVTRLGYAEDIYVRPTAYLQKGRYVASGDQLAAGFFMPVFPSPREPSIELGLRCQVSSWRRSDDETSPPRVKAAANYYNLRLARMEADANGFDEAILLNKAGKLAETGGASIFVVREGEVSTPRLTDSILESLTRSSVIELLAEKGITVRQREVERTELYVADEVFLAGTLSEITPVLTVDRHRVGTGVPGPVTKDVQSAYFAAVGGGAAGDSRGWLTPGPVIS